MFGIITAILGFIYIFFFPSFYGFFFLLSSIFLNFYTLSLPFLEHIENKQHSSFSSHFELSLFLLVYFLFIYAFLFLCCVFLHLWLSFRLSFPFSFSYLSNFVSISIVLPDFCYTSRVTRNGQTMSTIFSLLKTTRRKPSPLVFLTQCV